MSNRFVSDRTVNGHRPLLAGALPKQGNARQRSRIALGSGVRMHQRPSNKSGEAGPPGPEIARAGDRDGRGTSATPGAEGAGAMSRMQPA